MTQTYCEVAAAGEQLNSQSGVLVPTSGRNSHKSCLEWNLEIVGHDAAGVVVASKYLERVVKNGSTE